MNAYIYFNINVFESLFIFDLGCFSPPYIYKTGDFVNKGFVVLLVVPLQTLDFSLEERLSLADLTLALDNELLVSGNGIHQAALISYKTEIQHLL